MGAQTKTVGTSAATNTGNAFQQQLLAILNGQGNSSPFSTAITGMLNGQVNDPSGANAAITNGIANRQDYSNPYTSQTYVAPTLNQLNTNMFSGQTGMTNTNTGPLATSNFNTQQGYGMTPTSGYSDILTNLIKQGNSNVPQVGVGGASAGPGIALGAATDFNVGNSYYDAVKTDQKRQLDNAIAQNNARFGAAGAGAIGSGAELANSNLQSNAGAQNEIALHQIVQQLQQQDLAERGTAANVGLGSRGQDVQLALGNQDAQLRAGIANQGAGVNNLANIYQSLIAARGQDFTSQNQARGNDITQLGLGSQQSMYNAGQTNTYNQNAIQNALQNQLQGNNFSLDAGKLNSSNMAQNNADALASSNQNNNFNLSNAANVGNFQGSTNALNSNNWNALLGMGQGNNNTANSNIMNILQMLFGGGQQATAQGLPQTQVIQQPSVWGQVASGAVDLAGHAISRG